MKLPSDADLLRIFIGEDEKYKGKPLYQAILEEARADGLAGATVLRGVAGFGGSSRIHTSKILMLSEDLPMIVEIVDHPERIEEFVAKLEGMIRHGLVTLEKANVLAYRYGEKE